MSFLDIMTLRLTIACLLAFLFVSPGMALPIVSATQVAQGSDGERVTLLFDQPVTHKKFFRLDHPSRLVLDLPNAGAKGIGLPPGYRGSLVKAIRYAQFDPATLRVVIELNAPLAAARIEENGKSIVMDLQPAVGSATAGRQSTPKPSLKPERHLAPALPVIVIDAGHGGKDPGAAGRQTQEKNVTLRYAKILSAALKATKRYQPVLTRDDDRFILLGERVRIGERAAGNAFISLHADVAPMSAAHGVSVYTVAEAASDAEAQKLADQENSVDILAGFKVNVEDQEAAGILLELAQRETKNKASELADGLVASFAVDGIHLMPGPHRFAGFRVLKAPDVPSVLIETGFLSNGDDERQLNTDLYPKKLAAGIIRGLDAYFAKHPPK